MIFHYFNIKLLGKYSQTPVWQVCYVTAVKCFDLIDFHNNLMTWPNSNTAGICLDSRLKYSIITYRYAKKTSSFTWFLLWKLPIDRDFSHLICQFHQPCGINARNCFQGPAAPQQGMLGVWLSDDQPHFDYNGQWQGDCARWHSCIDPNQTHRGIKEMKKCAIKQIKICGEYRDMQPRPRLDFSGTDFCFYLKHDIELYIILNKYFLISTIHIISIRLHENNTYPTGFCCTTSLELWILSLSSGICLYSLI